MLSTVASIYDPLGFIAPFVLLGKQILQQMCREKIGWDEETRNLKTSMGVLDQRPSQSGGNANKQMLFTFRFTFQVKTYELHHFADASVSRYGECTYLQAFNKSNEVHCCLVMGKSRVSPTKVTTIPRLKLSAAVVAVQTSNMLRKELEIKDLQEYFWTDSTVVLGCINNDARRFQSIDRIKSSTKPEQWAYVASEDNPADHASRGLTAEQLKTLNWFTGPKFL